jgi:hypothetical protein
MYQRALILALLRDIYGIPIVANLLSPTNQVRADL